MTDPIVIADRPRGILATRNQGAMKIIQEIGNGWKTVKSCDEIDMD